VHLADLLSRVDSINREQRDRIVELARTQIEAAIPGILDWIRHELE